MPIQRGKSASRRGQRIDSRQKAVNPGDQSASNRQQTALASGNWAPGPAWQYKKRGYALAQSFSQLRQYKVASLTTLLVFGITLALPALIYFTAGSLTELGKRNVGEESITAYLSMSISDLDGAALAQRLNQQSGIAKASYISRDEALALFYEQADIGEAVEVLGENPLPGAIVIYPDTAMMSESDISALAGRLNQVDAIDRVQFDLKWVQRLQGVLNLARTVGWLLAAFLTITALLVVGNTIRLELLRRHTELEVSQLLGASRSFVHRPLLYTGALYGFLGGLIACLIAVGALYWLSGPAAELSSLYASSFQLVLPNWSQFLLVIGLTTVLGVLGAAATLYRASHQILPSGQNSL